MPRVSEDKKPGSLTCETQRTLCVSSINISSARGRPPAPDLLMKNELWEGRLRPRKNGCFLKNSGAEAPVSIQPPLRGEEMSTEPKRFLNSLFVAERNHRVDAGCPVGREKAGHKRNAKKQKRDTQIGKWVRGGDTK